MPPPALTPTEVRDLAHEGVGASQQGWTVITKELTTPGQSTLFDVGIEAPDTRMYGARYLIQSNGEPGRITGIEDVEGIVWRGIADEVWVEKWPPEPTSEG